MQSTAVQSPPSSADRTGAGDRTFRPDIQGLRSVAVVLVVLYHCGVPGLSGGYVGVDVFFVISGFLITRHLLTEHARSGRVSIRGFYARRIRRLLPPAVAVLVVTVLATRFFGPPLQAVPVARDGLFALVYLINFRLAALGVDYQHAGGVVSPLQHYWSLAVEEQFYILWPLLVVLTLVTCRRTGGAARLRALALVAGGVGMASLLASIRQTAGNAPLAYFASWTRAWELAAGALVAICVPALLRLPPLARSVAGWTGLGLIVASGVLFTSATPFPGIAAAAPVGGAVLVIASGLGGPVGAEALLGRPALQYGGRMSYGWYLWHWPVLVLAPSIVGQALAWPANLVAAGVAFFLAVLTNVLLEQTAARSRLRPGRWFVVGGALSAIAALVAGAIVLFPSGISGRGAPAAALDLATTDTDQLSVLLGAAYANPSVPSNLAPALAEAVDDVPPTTAAGCNVGFLTTTEPPCVYGDPDGGRTVVLFGDSHAEQWFGALNRLATERGWRLVSWTKAACPLADALLFSSQLHRPFTECPAWRANTLAAIARMHPDLVIASGSDGLPGAGYSNTQWTADTATTLASLTIAAARVVYLADVPAPTTDVPVCLAADPAAPQRCQFSRASQTQGLSAANQFPGRHAAAVAAATRLDIPVIDPTPWLCTDTGCPVVLADTLLYRDATHITQKYSVALAPLLGRTLADRVSWMSG